MSVPLLESIPMGLLLTYCGTVPARTSGVPAGPFIDCSELDDSVPSRARGVLPVAVLEPTGGTLLEGVMIMSFQVVKILDGIVACRVAAL
jgi:hypothetical protein